MHFSITYLVMLAWASYADSVDYIYGNSCSNYFGPERGGFGCLRLNGYDRRQSATCVSSKYLLQRSERRTFCFYYWYPFCWYPCMLETHRIGPRKDTDPNTYTVTDDCACDPKDIMPMNMDDLPNKCNYPDGSDCAWYRECLERRHQCAGGNNDYAIQYAEHFCNLYAHGSDAFSSQGKNWINAVRKCLQAALVPAMRPYYKGSCRDIKKTAFASHDACYLRPDATSPGICDLDPHDWWKIFWTVKGAIVSKDWYRSLWQMSVVGGACSKEFVFDSLMKLHQMVSVSLSFGSSQSELYLTGRQKRAADEELELDKKWEIVERAANGVAGYLQWNRDNFDWFAFMTEEGGTASNYTVNFWLRSISNHSDPRTVQNEAQKFEKWIASGKNQLSFDINGTEFSAMGFSTCNDSLCANVTKFVKFASTSASGIIASMELTSTSGISRGISVQLVLIIVFLALV
ncbi:uncharacterized protein LOC129595085 [Paramacrobiotus metropolitanus]|uniref:uncharacterized protein LOC129595085 n=1 Tax=Paramacrobiotus metropolitanus TaxID=2943436 RepID=UPI002445A76C|nr:uncharacterized protein LOC129595085 [Paramacrobiotus metropolitanus]